MSQDSLSRCTETQQESGDFLKSVLSEFQMRIEVKKNDIAPPNNSGNNTDTDDKTNGISDYSIYHKGVGGQTRLAPNQYFTLPTKTRVKRTFQQKTPPPKPRRMNQNNSPSSKTQVENVERRDVTRRANRNSLALDENRMSNELNEILQNAFPSDDKNNNREARDNDDTLKRRPSNSSSILNINGKYLADIAYIDDAVSTDGDTLRRSFDNSIGADQMSLMSEDEFDSLGSDEQSKSVPEDIVSVSSYDCSISGSRPGSQQSKVRDKLRKHISKKAAVQRERVGAFLGVAASNATGHLRKMKRKSMKIKEGKVKLVPITTKLTKHNGGSGSQTLAARKTSRDNSLNSDDTTSSVNTLPTLTESRMNGVRQMALKSGFLKKQGGMIKTWNERWFILKGDQLFYYKDRDGKQLGSISLPGNRIVMHPVRNSDNNKYVFEIFPGEDRQKMSHNHESYLFSATSQADMEEWVKVIRRVILSPFGGGIFGQRLDETMRYDRRLDSTGCATSSSERSGTGSSVSRRQAPIIVEHCVEFIRGNGGLKEEGLFRLPGHANEVKDLQDLYDMGERPVFPKSTDVHTVASLLKGYLRELPEPVIPFQRYDPLIAAAKLSRDCIDKVASSEETTEKEKNKEEAQKIMNDQLNLLPQPNFDLLRYLCRFLDEVQQMHEVNKMDISNLAMVFGPNILRAKREDPLIMMSDANYVQHVMFQFIANHEYFFPNDGTTQIGVSSIPDVAMDAAASLDAVGDGGIGTLNSVVSPNGTLGVRSNTDDSGTGSLGPTPENTSKRIPPAIPTNPPPTRVRPVKPNKPIRRRISEQMNFNEAQRKSLYDNVTQSSNASVDGVVTSKLLNKPNSDWRKSNESGEGIERSSHAPSTGESSYYVNNYSTPSALSVGGGSGTASPRSSTNAVAGSIGSPDSCRSTPVNEARVRLGSRENRRKRIPRQSPLDTACATDEESNTESVPPDDRILSTVSSLRGSFHIDTESKSSSSSRKAATTNKVPLSKRLSNESDGSNISLSTPPIPTRVHRRAKKDILGHIQNSSDHRGSQTETDLTSNADERLPVSTSSSSRSSNMVSSTTTSVCGRPLSYKEMEEQVKGLQDELRKQRVEHEKRSRMLEEHYIMKMRTSVSAMTPFTSALPPVFPPSPSLASTIPNPSYSSALEEVMTPSHTERGTSFSRLESMDESEMSSRRFSIDSETRYRDEAKRHAMTKIRLRNAERGLQQAEERNNQLQREMEEFFNTFGSMMAADTT